MTDGSNGDGRLGNTSTKRPQGKRWSFTINNPDMSIDQMKEIIGTMETTFYIFQEEQGEKGTRHYQGYIEFKNKVRLSAIKKILPKIHAEISKGTRQQNIDYCSKSKTKISGPYSNKPIARPLKIISELRPFQEQILKMIEEEPDDRIINWVIDGRGNSGKSAFIKYLMTTQREKTLFATGGKAGDIFNLFKNAIDAGFEGTAIFTYFLNLPRDSNSVSYTSLECIKDGLITNTKYEAGSIVFNGPHIWIFSNIEPDMERMTADRWRLWTINDKYELIRYVKED